MSSAHKVFMPVLSLNELNMPAGVPSVQRHKLPMKKELKRIPSRKKKLNKPQMLVQSNKFSQLVSERSKSKETTTESNFRSKTVQP